MLQWLILFTQKPALKLASILLPALFILSSCGGSGGGGSSSPDTSPPVISLNGVSTLTLIQGDSYIEAGASATDDRDGELSVTITGSVDSNTVGTYTLTYSATDAASNTGAAIRTVNVVLPADTSAPVITLNGASTLTLVLNASYIEAGASAVDDRDGNLNVTITGSVDSSIVGIYTLTYSATDAASNTGTATRTVNVELPADTTAPVITLNGVNPLTLIQNASYIEAGASAVDDRDGNLNVTITGSVDSSIVGTYTLTYSATDAASNTGTATRTVNVELPADVTAPVITLNGVNPLTLIQNDSYIEAGASAVDDRDGNLNVTITGSVDTSIVGSYTLTYSATDAASNTGTATRTVNVELPPDTTAPVIILNGASTQSVRQNNGYIEAGASAIDDRDGNVNVTITGSVDSSIVGTYTLTYTAIDAASNSSTAIRTVSVVAADLFITTWKTDNSGVSNNDQITITTSGTGYNYQIDWGDGLTDSNVTGDITHSYAAAGTYTVTISGAFPQIAFGGSLECNKLLSVEHWSNIQWRSMKSAFLNCSNLVVNATDIPDLSLVTDMDAMFSGANIFNQDISGWDVSSVTNMSRMFVNAYAFNQDISAWNVSSVTDMTAMFFNASAFNQDISAWDVSAVTNMASMFARASALNQDISVWNVSAVTNMSGMFSLASAFNQPLGTWNTSMVTNMASMFSGASIFNQDISGWDVSSVTNMSNMFDGAISFNQNISGWNVSMVTTMRNMFFDAKAFNQGIGAWNVSSVVDMAFMFGRAETFNQDISTWNVSLVTDMAFMFFATKAFNQDISTWNVSSVTGMRAMFADSVAFNQDISAWNVSLVTSMENMFNGSSAFNQNVGMWDVSSVTNMKNMFLNSMISTANYDALLSGWSAQSLQNDVLFSAGTTQYSSTSQAARDTLTGAFNWTVTDGGVAP